MALSFVSGSQQYLSKSAALFSGSSTDYNFSLSAWVKPASRHTGSIIGADAGSGNSGRFALFTQNGKFAARRKSSYIMQTSQFATDNTDWFHVLGVWQYNSRALYVNGVNVASEPGNKLGGGQAGTTNISLDPTAGTTFYIGRDHSGKYFNGVIAEAAAYSVYLSAGDIASLAAGFSPSMVRPESLIGYWPLGGAVSNDYADPFGQHTLTPTNTPTAADHPRIIYPTGVSTFDYAAPVVEEEAPPAAERGWMFESMQVGAATGGRRRLSPPDTRTASSSKGWGIESLQVGVSGGGARKK